METTAGINRLW